MIPITFGNLIGKHVKLVVHPNVGVDPVGCHSQRKWCSVPTIAPPAYDELGIITQILGLKPGT